LFAVATYPGMRSPAKVDVPSPLERLVAALVDWGGTASQIVSHMELSKLGRIHREPIGGRRVHGLLAETLEPVLAGRENELENAAEPIEKSSKPSTTRSVHDEIYMVPLTPPRPRGRVRRRPE
jgi:hypothetical protein